MPNPLQSFRRDRISKPILAKMRQVLPPLSATEQDALEAGTVGWDAELFSGKPDWNKLLTFPCTELSTEKAAMIRKEPLNTSMMTAAYSKAPKLLKNSNNPLPADQAPSKEFSNA